MSYVRKLKLSEVERRFIYIEAKYREMFPPPKYPFKLIVDNEEFEVCLDSYGRVWGAPFWDKLSNVKIGDKIVITMNEDGSYTLKKKGR